MPVPVYISLRSACSSDPGLCVLVIVESLNVLCIKVNFEEGCVHFHLIHVGVVEALYVRVTPGICREILSPALEYIDSIMGILY